MKKKITKTTTKAVKLPPYVSLPRTQKACEAPKTDPARWLYSFSAYVLEQVDNAEFELRTINWLHPELALAAIYAAKSAGVEDEWIKGLAAERADCEALREFFMLSLQRARHENTIRQFDFWARASLTDVCQELLDDDRQDNFNALFELFLRETSWRRGEWDISGLTVDGLWEAFQQNGEVTT